MMSTDLFLDHCTDLTDDLVEFFQRGDWRRLQQLCDEIAASAALFQLDELALRASETKIAIQRDPVSEGVALAVLRLVAICGKMRVRGTSQVLWSSEN